MEQQVFHTQLGGAHQLHESAVSSGGILWNLLLRIRLRSDFHGTKPSVGLDQPVTQTHDAAGMRSDFLFVSHEDNGLARGIQFF